MLIRISHIILAFLLFISSTGFTVNQHFCQNELKDVQLFCQPKSCHDILKKEMPPCHKKMAATADKKSCEHQSEEDQKGCCNNTTDFVQLDLDQQYTSAELKDFNFTAFFAVMVTIFQIDFPTVDHKSTHFQHYSPPLIVTDYTAELQTFLL